MNRLLRPTLALALAALLPAPAAAQSTERPFDLRPAAATTVAGDTGLWHVPAADVLPAGVISAGVHHASELRNQGLTRVSTTTGTLAGGIGDGIELFGSWAFSSEIQGQRARGDLLAGAKLALLSQQRGAPVGLGMRGVAKLATADADAGFGTGRPDILAQVVASRRFGVTEITGASGLVWRGSPDGVDLPTGIRSGVGLAVLAHPALRIFTELHGEHYLDDMPAVARVSPFDTPLTAGAGASWHLAHGFTVSGAVSRPVRGPEPIRGVGAMVRFGFRPLVRRASDPDRVVTAPAAPLPPPAARPAPAAQVPAARVAPPVAAALPAVPSFRDIQFDLDRHTLRPGALPILDEIVVAMQANPALHLRIEGHACDIGTAEYNLALGERRANSVREYLSSRGIAASRLDIISYGEERQKHGSGSESSRALNRRAEFVVSVHQSE